MKKTFFTLLIMLSFGFLLTGCQQDEVILSDKIIPIDNFIVSDPQIKKEIAFLRSEGIINNTIYKKWSTMSEDEIIFTGWLAKKVSETEIWEPEYYVISPIGASDGTIIHRKEVQKMMEEKNKMKRE